MSIEIEAAVLVETNTPLELQTLTHEPLTSGQVLVEIAYSGVCGSQLLEIKGLRGPDRFLPHLLGHEGSGIVAEIGPDVTKVKPGDHVVVTWIAGEGINSGGTRYTASDSQIVNAGPVATFSNRAVVSENRLLPIDTRFSLRQAALLGCCLPTGAGTVLNLANIDAGDSVAIIGVGGVGLSAVLGAKMAGAGVIVAVDRNAANLELAMALGATHSLNSAEVDAIRASNEIVSGGRFDATVEASGRTELMEMAISLTRDEGICVIAGNPSAGSRIAVDPFELIKGKRIVGSWGGGTVPDRDIPKYVKAQLVGEIDFSPLIGSEYDLDRINDAIAELESGTAGRVLLRTNPSISDSGSTS
ncbi:MAG: zinc-binding dehydrogenase [Chloroflexi bacterium]|nr:zinc-binding dehydrogenase [Chloroflexota bacterium]